MSASLCRVVMEQPVLTLLDLIIVTVLMDSLERTVEMVSQTF